jgi:hypothetical protein
MYDLQNFSFTQMIRAGADLRKMGDGADSMEMAAGRIVRYLYENLSTNPSGQKACALVRLFKTHAFGELDEELRDVASGILRSAPASPSMKCLTLLATVGEKPEWNSRASSEGHKAIPLASEKAVESAPMISQLLSQLGVRVKTLLGASPGLLLNPDQPDFNVFHVAEAQGSPYVPAQKEFVVPYGIKSVLGFGGLLPSGDLFVVILFCKVRVPRESADLFKTLALSAKLALVPFSGGRIFA